MKSITRNVSAIVLAFLLIIGMAALIPSSESKAIDLHEGIDVSQWQDNIDWNAVRSSGREYAIIKACGRGWSQGTLKDDPACFWHVLGAKSAGLQVGLYSYSQATNEWEAMEEANRLADLADGFKSGGFPIDLPLVFDYEFSGKSDGYLDRANLSYDQKTVICQAFCNAVRARGYQPMIYANTNMLTAHMNGYSLSQSNPIWVAEYGSNNGSYSRFCPSFYGNYTCWQYTSRGAVPGINGFCDLDLWYGPIGATEPYVFERNGQLVYGINGNIYTSYSGMQYYNNNFYYFTNGVQDPNYTGMANNEWGWWYFRNGQLDWSYTGEATNVFGTWFYQNGTINFNTNGMQYTGSEWRMIRGGLVQTAYTGMANIASDFYYFENGHLSNYTGMASNEWGWWYYKDGKLDWNFTGEVPNIFGTWFYQNGRINFETSGMQFTGSEWRMVQGGLVLTSYTGMGNVPWGWYYFENGHLSNYTGMAANVFGWWYYRDGQLDWSYTGFAENIFGQWLYLYGTIPFWYSGPFDYEGHTYYINGGHVDAII